ncbi:DUF4232 domain-containing protein [Nocardia sp. NBC_00511]|uniref:DUF4232 domain-containing protein n=1 Tax=Nocardia sp. NBC_00511 TaxID=2903591 RepID=UPI0030DF1C61
MSKTAFIVAAAGAIALAASGCSTSDSGGTTAPATSSGNPTGAVSQNGSSGTSNQPPTSFTAAMGSAPCASGTVDVTAETMSAAAGHRGVRLTFSLIDAGQGSCSLSGYPGADAVGADATVHATRSLNGYMGGLPTGDDTMPTVILSATHSAQAVLEAVTCGVYNKPESVSAKILVTAPNSTDTRTLDQGIDTCDLQIHPVTG